MNIVELIKVILMVLTTSRSIFGRNNPLRSVLMFHLNVFENWRSLTRKVDDAVIVVDSPVFIEYWIVIATIFSIIGGIFIVPRWPEDTVVFVSFVLTSGIVPFISFRPRSRAFFNISLPLFILVFFVIRSIFSSSFEIITYVSLESISFVITGYLLELFIVLIVYHISVYWNGRLNASLDESTIKNAVFGLFWTFVTSIVILAMWMYFIIHNFASFDKLVIFSLASAVLGMVLWFFVYSYVWNSTVHLLWKTNVSTFSRLPHLIVKTKSGNIFFGQLYDPLDGKLLIIHNANLVIHDGREVSETLKKITFDTTYAKDGAKEPANYISIPWDEIEALQIVESGLYAQQANQEEESEESKEKSGLRCMFSWLFRNTIVKFGELLKEFGVRIKDSTKGLVRRIDNKLRQRFC